MSWIMENILSVLVFSPLLVAVAVIVSPTELISKAVGLAGSVVIFVLSVVLFLNFDSSIGTYQFVENKEWLPAIGVRYFLGIDGISLYLVLLTTLLLPIIVLAAWKAVESQIKRYLFFFFILEATVLGAFLSLDLFLFYVFWEAMLIPMFFLIGVWGGKDRIFAAQKFLLYTFAGSVPMLVAIIYLVFLSKVQLGSYSAALPELLKLQIPGEGAFSTQGLIFMAFSLAFAIKVPLFPLHTWLPDAHVQAPTGGSVILAGVLLKLGGYGLMRFAMPLSPAVLSIYAPWMMGIAAIAIVYGACLAIAQDDIKKLVAYSSVSHMGYVILGLFAMNQIGVTGSLYQMLNHGVSTGALFLLVGVLYERTHTRAIADYSGLAKTVPLFSIIMIIVTFSSVALPGTNGFVGEFLILQGGFLAQPWFTAVAGTGVVLGAVYMLWLCQRILFGEAKENEHTHHLTDINFREFVYLAPLLALIFVMGLYPKTFFNKMEPSILEFQKRVSIHAPMKEGKADPKALPLVVKNLKEDVQL